MKTYSFLLFCTVFCLFSCQETRGPQENFKINGSISGIDDSTFLFLRYNMNDSMHIDSVLVQDHLFSFKGKVNEPTSAYIFLADYKGYFEIFLENADIEVYGNIDSLEKVQITGSASQMELEKLHDKQKEYSSDGLISEYLQARENGDEELMGILEQKIDSIDQLQETIIKSFIEENPESYVSIHQLPSLAYSSSYEELDTLYSGLSPTIQESEAGKKFAEYLIKRSKTSIGQVAPDFTQVDSSGVEISLSDFRGQYVLLDFWAAWCGPCRAENPNVVKNFNKYKDRGFTVFGVSLDNERNRWLRAIKKDGLTWTQVSDLKGWKNEVADQYGIRAIPANFLLDPDGKILVQNLREDALGEKLEELLK